MAIPTKNPDTGGHRVGVERAYQEYRDANLTAWQRWARKARVSRLTARQRRVVLTMTTSPGLTPERALGARHG